jgi:hypothetical protein
MRAELRRWVVPHGSSWASIAKGRCTVCGHPIIWPGGCYTCATGRARVLIRAEETELHFDARGSRAAPN